MKTLAEEKGLLFMVTYTYMGYITAKHARHVVRSGEIGDVRMVMAEYPQGWLAFEGETGARGVYWTSQLAIGCDNSLRVRIYGSKGTILWFQETPEKITVIKEDGSINEIHRGYASIAPEAARYGRLPAGHPEGWIESMANLYDSFIRCVHAKRDGTFTPDSIDYPTIDDGLEGLQFVEACLESNQKGNSWVDID